MAGSEKQSEEILDQFPPLEFEDQEKEPQEGEDIPPQEEETDDKPVSLFMIFAGLILALMVLVGLIFFQELFNPKQTRGEKPIAEATAGPKVLKVLNSSQDLPKVDPDAWELILVGPKNVKEELSPELSEVSGFMVDSRIAEATANFLAAAQAIDPNAHLITGYRSVEEQSSLYETFLAEEMEARQIGREAAESFVQTYFQAPGTSEHMTGLAIDLSTVDYLNLMDPGVASQLATIAPDYGFVLRYKQSYQPQTGVPAEDWHFRYVGVESARYMTDYDVPLETYLVQLKNRTD
ncbi:D-alanyl-D-alanine carboxypeptidase family protein [Streptococcus ovuberis]|nr:D-alanyl-D-alanine carboxypeptidase family protein [Streptococcus ovuberis]